MIGLLMLAAAAMSAANRFDLSCAEAATWAQVQAVSPLTQDQRSTFRATTMFYVGRLTGRDDGENWLGMMLDEAKTHPRSTAQYQADLNVCVARMTDKLNARARPR